MDTANTILSIISILLSLPLAISAIWHYFRRLRVASIDIMPCTKGVDVPYILCLKVSVHNPSTRLKYLNSIGIADAILEGKSLSILHRDCFARRRYYQKSRRLDFITYEVFELMRSDIEQHPRTHESCKVALRGARPDALPIAIPPLETRSIIVDFYPTSEESSNSVIMEHITSQNEQLCENWNTYTRRRSEHVSEPIHPPKLSSCLYLCVQIRSRFSRTQIVPARAYSIPHSEELLISKGSSVAERTNYCD